MKRTICLIFLTTLIFIQMGCTQKMDAIESISISFPFGETRLLVRSNGESLLFYGALPQYQQVKQSVFDVDELYTQLQPRLYDNVPREAWLDPRSQAGMVNILFNDGTTKEYLIFDQAFAERLFSKAKENIR